MDKLPASRVKELPAFECHTICRAIAEHITDLTVVDGNYFGLKRVRRKTGQAVSRFAHHSLLCTHSWLCTLSGAIIDPYPVGFITPNPVLVVNRGTHQPFGSGLYIPDNSVARSFRKLQIVRKSRILLSLVQEATRS